MIEIWIGPGKHYYYNFFFFVTACACVQKNMKLPGFLRIFLKVVSHCWSEAEVAGPVVTQAEDDGMERKIKTDTGFPKQQFSANLSQKRKS